MTGDWRDRAACLAEDPELFFPITNTGPGLAQAMEARRVCESCPVRSACLGWALTHGMEHGVWGATDERQRRTMRHREHAPEQRHLMSSVKSDILNPPHERVRS